MTTLTRVRLILMVFMGLSGYLFFQSITGFDNSADGIASRIIFGSITGAPLLWSVLMFLGLLYKTDQDIDGAICLAPGHLLLKVSGLASDITNDNIPSLGKDKFQPCPLYWIASGLTLLGVVLLAIVAMLIYFIAIAPFAGNLVGLYVTGGLLGLVAIVVLGYWAWDQLPRNIQRLGESVGRIVLASLLGSFFSILLITAYIESGLTLTRLIIGILCMVVATAALIGLVCGVLSLIGKIADSKPGRWLDSKKVRVKARWCPQVRQCSK